MSDHKHPVFAASGLTCPVPDCRGELAPEGADARHHGPGVHRYSRVSRWAFADRVDHPARCRTCGRRDVVVHFVTTYRNPVTDKFILQSELDAPLNL